MHLMDNIFLLRSFMNTYDTLFLMACAINSLTCVYAEDLIFPLPLGHMLETLSYSVFLFEKVKKSTPEGFSPLFFFSFLFCFTCN